jgi:transcriptional regulator with XRE-family HTH domain
VTEAARRRLGDHVRDRRVELGLHINDAADAAGLNPKTWTALERGSRATRDSNYRDIERVLRWRHGSVVRALEGQAPIPVESAPPQLQPPATPTPELPDDLPEWDLRAQVAWVKRQPWPATDKLAMIQYLFELDQQAGGTASRLAG